MPDNKSGNGLLSQTTVNMKRLTILLIFTACTLLTAVSQSRVDSVAYRALQVGRVMQQERVFLHFDNTAYYLGETIWFKAYVSFGNNDRPSVLSKVLYVELVAPEGYVVQTKKYKIGDDGSCYGEFELDPLLLSGYYEIRAYTRYMLNWDKSAVFSRVFPIFDKVNADNWDFKNMLDRRRGFREKGEWVSAELPEATLEFFPEGGNLVAGLESRVAFELRGKDGIPGKEKITIFEDGKAILESTPEHMGKGTFELTPRKGAKYRAEVTMTDGKGKTKKHKFDLPEIAEEGVVMRITERGDSIDVIARNNMPESHELGFSILYRGSMGIFKKFMTDDKEISFTFSKASLPEGVNRAVMFIDGNTPLAERQFFITHDTLQKNDRGTVKLNVTANGYFPNNLEASPNEKITLKIAREDGKPIPQNTDISLVVNDAAGKQATSYGHNFYSYLLLGSELKGYIPDATQYFDKENAERARQLDLIMLTHGWTSYNWNLLTREEIKSMQPVERSITLNGMFLRKHKNEKIGNNTLVVTPQPYTLTRLDMAADRKKIETTTFRTDSTGAFTLDLGDFYGTRIASLRPQTTFKHSRNISYQFALNRYYSPGFRLYDYWERTLGTSVESSDKNKGLVKINPFEYMLSSLEVVADKKREINGRPPHSEMRFNYLDEWEYAQDVTYLDRFNTYDDNLFQDALDDIYTKDTAFDTLAVQNDEIISLPLTLERIPNSEETITAVRSVDENVQIIRYVGSIRWGNKETPSLTVDHDYDHTLTANDVVLSAMRRHNYNWAYWVQLMVVLGEYDSKRAPEPDKEYLRGIHDVGKMTNFKEFVIRSDEKTRMQFENRDNYWTPLGRMMDNKVPVQKFYKGFLSQSYLFTGEGMDGCPDSRTFQNSISRRNGIAYPMNPNYVACLIPYTEKDSTMGIIPEFAATGSSLRYTSVQGYSESKEFYSPDYSRMKPDGKDYRRTLLWIPEVKIENGEAVIELYNSDNCRNINVSVTGRDNVTIYSNDETTYTREQTEMPVQPKSQVQEKKVEEKKVVLDAETEAACAREHEKGVIYFNQGRYRDAITIFAELIQYGYAPSMHYVGICYRDGMGLTVNDGMAKQFFGKAANNGHFSSMFDLAKIIEKENGCVTDSAFMLYRDAAELMEPRALIQMAHLYRDGTIVEKDEEKHEELLSKAAAAGHPQGLTEYGIVLIEKGREGIGFIKRSAELKNKEALFYMMEHEHNAGNFKEAYGYAKELHLQGFHEGTKRMADYYYEGKGTGRDKGLAKDLYREAANAGNQEAAKILKEL